MEKLKNFLISLLASSVCTPFLKDSLSFFLLLSSEISFKGLVSQLLENGISVEFMPIPKENTNKVQSPSLTFSLPKLDSLGQSNPRRKVSMCLDCVVLSSDDILIEKHVLLLFSDTA
jgi:hypothetical protein